MANRIYATREVVIRVAREHEEALRDARTESIAAPAAYAAGLLTPRLLIFDDSGEVLDRPYSVWERVHGETLGVLASDSLPMTQTWRRVGQQMAQLHVRVETVDDPKRYLHEPMRDLSLPSLLEQLAAAGRVRDNQQRAISRLIGELTPAVREEIAPRFLHSDIHGMNIMCTRADELLALIDWGDAGWGDPTFDFRQIPLPAFPQVLEGYQDVAPRLLGGSLKERMVWDKLADALERAMKDPSSIIPVDEYLQFLE